MFTRDAVISLSLRIACLLGIACALSAGSAAGQEPYPSRPITLIVPFPPGGVADIVGRPFAEALGRELKVPVVIENRAGAGGGIGMGYVAKAKPDGYTLLLALSSISILPEADKVTGRTPMYQLDQLTPIARLTADPTVLAVRAESPWKTLADFAADARQRPGAMTYGSSGNYGTMHMPMEMFAATAGVKLLHVPFTGAGPAVVASSTPSPPVRRPSSRRSRPASCAYLPAGATSGSRRCPMCRR